MHVCDMTHSCVWHDSFKCVTWLISVCGMRFIRMYNFVILLGPKQSRKYTYEKVMSHTQMSHVTHMNESCHTHEWVMSLMSLSQVTHMNESRHENDWAVSHIWISHRTHVDESCPTNGWVMSHPSMSHVTHKHESCVPRTCRTYTFKWVMSHVWMSRVTHMNKSHHTHDWVTSNATS